MKKPRVKCKPIEPGQRHGNLVIESLAGISERKLKRWNCKCDCGRLWIANDQDIKRGKTQRCRKCGDLQAGDKRRGKKLNRKSPYTAASEKPEGPAKPKPAKAKDTESTYSKHTPNYAYLSRQPAVSAEDAKTALIISERRNMTRWSIIAELVGLTVDECKARCPQHAA